LGNFWTNVNNKKLDAKFNYFCQILFIGKNRQILDITKLGEKRKEKKDRELGMKKITNFN
jgi:hypothetical protein